MPDPVPYGQSPAAAYESSMALADRAAETIPGGSSTHSRVATQFEPNPQLFVQSGDGATIVDADGNEYVDYNCAHGAVVRGHAPDEQVEAIQSQVEDGVLFGAPHEVETRTAELVAELVPCADRVKFATSGTHGNSAAIKLARVHTGKEKVLKFEGGYHGHVDALAYNGGSNVAAPGSRNDPYTVPMEPGLTPGSAEGVEVLPWNDADLLAETLERPGDEIAAVIAEPIPANAGLFWPADGYLERVRDLTREHDVVLIFDEVVTGFRVSLHGAQGYLDVEPDLAVFGKGLGNGLPVAALVGRREVMDEYDDHAVFSGTYSGGPLALAGTHANLRALRAAGEETYEAVRDRSQRLCEGLHEIAADAGHAVCPSRAAGFFKLNLVDERVDAIREWRDVHEHVRSETVTAFAREMIGEGSFIYPGHSRIALTTAHTDAHTERTLEHAKAAFERVPS